MQYNLSLNLDGHPKAAPWRTGDKVLRNGIRYYVSDVYEDTADGRALLRCHAYGEERIALFFENEVIRVEESKIKA